MLKPRNLFFLLKKTKNPQQTNPVWPVCRRDLYTRARSGRGGCRVGSGWAVGRTLLNVAFTVRPHTSLLFFALFFCLRPSSLKRKKWRAEHWGCPASSTHMAKGMHRITLSLIGGVSNYNHEYHFTGTRLRNMTTCESWFLCVSTAPDAVVGPGTETPK